VIGALPTVRAAGGKRNRPFFSDRARMEVHVDFKIILMALNKCLQVIWNFFVS